MFSQSEPEKQEEPNVKAKNNVPYINHYHQQYDKSTNSINLNDLDSLLEKEKQINKTDQWNKIDKTVKTQILHSYAEKYGNEHNLPIKEIKHLKLFFSECLNKGKLQKNKDVTYARDTQQITAIPALYFNSDKKSFTLKILDNKRVSTLKSLTPKKNTSEKNTSEKI